MDRNRARERGLYIYNLLGGYVHAYPIELKNSGLTKRSSYNANLKQNVFSYYRMCSLTTECVVLLQNAFAYYRMCSLTTECVL